MVQDTNNKEYIKIQFKTISWSLRIPTNYCSKLYVLRVTSALLYSGVCLGYDNVTEVHLSKEKLFLKDRSEKGKKWTGEEGVSIMGNRCIWFPHSNCETRNGGFMDILEKWNVTGILFLEIMDLPTTDFPVLQHTNILG